VENKSLRKQEASPQRERDKERFVIQEQAALKGYAYGSCYLDHVPLRNAQFPNG